MNLKRLLFPSLLVGAVLAMILAGKIELDALVQRYLPWFRVADPQASAQMTVRHLLNQTSGLPTSSGEIVSADFDNSPGAAERQARAVNARARPPGRLGVRIQQLELPCARADHRGRQW